MSHSPQKFIATANAIRALAMDSVQAANSGHPGAPMGMADIADVLWRKHLKHNPKNAKWVNRDRFVLSNGHGSMLLYALLHLSGYKVSIEDLKNFRQLHSKTPGHPEYGMTDGVETTTGPLGQGFANAVGLALAEKMLAARYNQDSNIIDHRTWCFLGDGCLMEGVSHEVGSLAGTWGLNKLTLFYDMNNISIDGAINDWFTDNTAMRFAAYGWQTIGPIDGHNQDAINAAINEAKKETAKPTIILCKTLIGNGSPNKQGTSATHGAPLGAEEIAATRAHIGWSHPAFEIPKDISAAWDCSKAGQESETAWQKQWDIYQKAQPKLAEELARRLSGTLPSDFSETIESMIHELRANEKAIASRKASEICLKTLVPNIPELTGGSADLACSNLTDTEGSKDIMKTPVGAGNRISYGVREFGMCAIANGLSLHGGFRPFVATFLVFSDYARNAIRMSALMHQPIVYVMTHDSIGLGEDGPTHQPVEHVASLRIIPNLRVWRPADAVETAIAWRESLMTKEGPSLLALSRQGLAVNHRSAEQESNIARGGYILCERDKPKAVIIATGSEVQLATASAQTLQEAGINVRVVSMPCPEIFAQQEASYQASVLPEGLPRIAVEAGNTHYWKGWVGLSGKVIGMEGFGESAPAAQLFELFGITSAKIIEAVKSVI